MVLLNVRGKPLGFYKICMKTCGLWPLDSYKRGSIMLFAVTLLVQMVMIVVRLIDPLGKCPEHHLDYLDTIVTIMKLIAFAQQLALRVDGARMIPLIESTIDDWSSITNPEERDIMKLHDKSGSLFFYALFLDPIIGLIYRIITDFGLIPEVAAMDNNRVICAFSDGSLWVYVMIVLDLTSHILYNAVKTGEVLFWSLGMHLAGQFKILKGQFEDYLLIKNEKESRKEFLRLVDRHNQLLALCEDLAHSFGVFMAIRISYLQYGICISAMALCNCIAMYMIVTAITSFSTTVSMNLAKLFVYHYVGDYLTECCEEIGSVFTECEWYNLSKGSRRNFGIVISRCQQPVSLTLVKVCKLNLHNFKYTVESLYSYVSCIIAIM